MVYHVNLVTFQCFHLLVYVYIGVHMHMMITRNKNPAMTKLLETLLTSYTAPKSHKLALAILKACPDQVNTFLKHLYPHLVPRSVDTWIACVQFFKQVQLANDIVKWVSGMLVELSLVIIN